VIHKIKITEKKEEKAAWEQGEENKDSTNDRIEFLSIFFVNFINTKNGGDSEN
jgi:hypothetical protein